MFVQFDDEAQTSIRAVFSCPQNLDDCPHQGEVAEDDPRLLASGLILPIAVADDQEAIGRAWRDAEIIRVTWLRDRHRDEVEIGAETTISAEQYAELLAYIKALRDWPATAEFPAEDSRPVMPEWMASQAL
ncbi:phage tail assembly chaperone [Pseudomonas sp. S2_A02]